MSFMVAIGQFLQVLLYNGYSTWLQCSGMGAVWCNKLHKFREAL